MRTRALLINFKRVPHVSFALRIMTARLGLRANAYGYESRMRFSQLVLNALQLCRKTVLNNPFVATKVAIL